MESWTQEGRGEGVSEAKIQERGGSERAFCIQKFAHRSL